jgi:lipopolysaccharide transport system permease protein
MGKRAFFAESSANAGETRSIKAAVASIRIESTKGRVSLNLREIWAFRELIYFLIWRDIKVRYKQTLLGGTWAIIQPFFTMVVFSLFFGKLAKIPSDGVPYPIFSLTALVPWAFFATGMNMASNSLVANARLITKVYFPRICMPIASVAGGVLDFAIAFVVLLGMILWYGIIPSVKMVWLLFFLILAFFTSLGASLWLSAIYVRFHDVRHVIPFLTQIWLFATPVAYPASLIPEPWYTIYGINPMTGVVEGFRWALLNTNTNPGPTIILSSLITLGLLISGAFYFRRIERTFADII